MVKYNASNTSRNAADIVLVLHDIRSAHNVGALLRTADAMAVEHVFFTGYTPYPEQPQDTRLPHVSQKTHAQIAKTALGAEQNVPSSKHESIHTLIKELQAANAIVAAVEQHPSAVQLEDYTIPKGKKIALILGNEVEGVDNDILSVIDTVIEVPMLGKKESLNVSAAGAIVMHWLRFTK